MISPNTLESNIGAMQVAAIGLLLFLNSFKTFSIYSSTYISLPLKPKSQKFLAAPKPPGKIKQSKSSTFNWFISIHYPLAILFDSTNIFLYSLVSSPFKWLITWVIFLSKEKH